MMFRFRTVCAAMAGAMAFIAVPAGAATDTTPPVLNLPPSAAFVTGQTLTDRLVATSTETLYSGDIPVRLAWSASDASGICDYETAAIPAGAPWEYGSVGPTVRSWRGTTTDYDGSFGGGTGVIIQMAVRARDCAGNTTEKSASLRTHIFQETGESSSAFPIPVTYRGPWGSSRCACWLGDGARRTTARNASVSFVVTVPLDGHRVAVVTNTGPTRGSFDIVVDGVRRATYNAHAREVAKKNSVIAWQAALPAGDHRVTLVNRATPGHPRMDVDAVLVTERTF
jgi:hypothetical protein